MAARRLLARDIERMENTSFALGIVDGAPPPGDATTESANCPTTCCNPYCPTFDCEALEHLLDMVGQTGAVAELDQR